MYCSYYDLIHVFLCRELSQCFDSHNSDVRLLWPAHTVVGTPVLLLFIHAIIQADNHVTAVKYIKSRRYKSGVSVNVHMRNKIKSQ